MTRFACRGCDWTSDVAHEAVTHGGVGHVTYFKPQRQIVTESGRTKPLPADLEPARIAGLDEAGRIVVNDFDGDMLFGLTLCCNAYDKGVEDGVVCRGCYGMADIGNYIYRDPDGSYPGLDPVKEVT